MYAVLIFTQIICRSTPSDNAFGVHGLYSLNVMVGYSKLGAVNVPNTDDISRRFRIRYARLKCNYNIVVAKFASIFLSFFVNKDPSIV